jgi:hypothetical protein
VAIAAMMRRAAAERRGASLVEQTALSRSGAAPRRALRHAPLDQRADHEQ